MTVRPLASCLRGWEAHAGPGSKMSGLRVAQRWSREQEGLLSQRSDCSSEANQRRRC